MSEALFSTFAETAEQVGATTKRLEKASLLGAYFGTLGDDDLLHAARYFAGHPFPLHDQRTTNVGGAALVTALLQATGIEEADLRRLIVARGEAGDVAGEVWANTPHLAAREPRMTLADVAAFLETLAATAGTKSKTALIVEALGRAATPEAKYLVKLLQGDLRIGLREGAVEDALARLAGVSVEAVQRANMLTGDIGETALLARHGRLETARMRLFHPLKFMLATAADSPEDVARQMPPAFVVEDKFDGIRAQAHIGGTGLDGTVRLALFSRTLDEIGGSFPDLTAPLTALAEAYPDGLILDGEIVPVAPDADGRGRILPFQSLQPRLGRKAVTTEMLGQAPVAYVAYDVLFAGGRVLLDEPFHERRAILAALPFDGRTARLTESKTFDGISALDNEFAAARARGNEGLMVKDPASAYKPGRRGREWLKVKKALATLDVVVTAAQVGEGRRSRFLSDYTFAVRASEDDPTLLNVGKAYSGLTDVETQWLSDWCMAHTREVFAHGKVRTVEPRIVLEVTFDRVQPSARHKSGYALRFPRILRIREDKPPEEADTLHSVRRLYEELEGVNA
jgi:DNA ligase-1